MKTDDAYAAELLNMIREDIASGQVPATVSTFSELHDYVDANDYIIQSSLYSHRNWSDDREETINRVTDLVDAALKAGIRT
jgi:hypothetical protein